MPNSLFSVEFVNTAGVNDLEAAQREMRRLLNEVDPRGGARTTLRLALGMLHRHSTGIVHVRSGRLKNSIFWREETSPNALVGIVATNVGYSIFEHRRGGSHAFFARTVAEEGPNVNNLFGARVAGPGGSLS